jgi:CheY-like chemotaxis protein
MPKIKILVVEDESLVAKDIQNMLRGLGYDVLDVLSTGEEAIAALGRSDPDLILMDIVLKGEIDGIVAAERIWEKYGIPVIYLTAYRAVRLHPQALRRARAADHDRDGLLQGQNGQDPAGARGMAFDDP